MKLLKRYANRRLYDPETSSTITLEDVAKMIIGGEEIKVQDNMSGEDITPKILGQTFLKVSLGQRNEDFSNFMLTSLIRETGRDVSGLFERLVLGGIGANYLTSERLEKIVNSMVELGELREVDFSNYREDLLKKMAMRASEKKEQIQKDLEKFSQSILVEDNATLGDLSEKLKEVAEKLKEN
ncbi:polyhydroxyalkanoate synthesis regulator DNA-binding domain-containing protein [Leptospira sp. 96542]|nr:polyhydroxyalkanoate synthesis regulator DNA-binding domain-containing protein [Leptospira sp. 96542]